MNKLENGMIFKSAIQLAKYLEFKDCRHSNAILQTLSHYCDFHRDENKKIYIDNVFDTIIPFKQMNAKYKPGEIVKTKTGVIQILKTSIVKDKNNHARRLCNCKCLKHDYIFDLYEYRITSSGIGCPICGNKKIIPNIRTLYDCHPEVIKYLYNPEDAKNMTPRNGKKIKCKCPNCGNTKDVAVNNLIGHGFSCNFCSSGISYPNKFITALLSQFNIPFETEKVFNWSNKKRYDHYVLNKKILIENHGLQHYEECYLQEISNVSLEEIRCNDAYKKQMAISHGFQYIEIDCRKSNKDWISNNILKSELLNLLKINKDMVNWDKCDEYARLQVQKLIWDDWNLTHDSDYLTSKYNLSEYTIRDVINDGYKNNKCDIKFCPKYLTDISYDIKERASIICNQVHSKPIHCITDDTYFYSKKECYEYYKNIFPTKTKCNGLYVFINSNRMYKNKSFEYITKEQFNAVKRNSEKNNIKNVFGDFYFDRYL